MFEYFIQLVTDCQFKKEYDFFQKVWKDHTSLINLILVFPKCIMLYFKYLKHFECFIYKRESFIPLYKSLF